MYFYQILLCLLAIDISGYAQDRRISGKVTTEQGQVLPGVSITVKGTTEGTITSKDGVFDLSVPAHATLVVSFIGFKKEEILTDGKTNLDIILLSDQLQLNEVVVTALGISRDKKALGYSIQEIKAEDLTIARDPNVGNALAGKIAGVQVLGQSGAKFGKPNIRVRGTNSLTGADPLYVVDGTPTDISQVNMDDVESLTVLKGPSATALYGNRASAGVIVITTKRAKAGETKLDVNYSVTLDEVGMLPKYQDEYGGGTSQTWETFKYNPALHPATWASFDGHNILDYSIDESWGPKLDGTLHRSAASWLPGEGFGKLTPFSPQPNNVKDFFEKPFSHNANVAFSKAGENYTSRISYTHISNNGVVPNSRQTRDFISARNSLTFTSRLTGELNFNYTATKATNTPADNFGTAGGTGISNEVLGVSSRPLNGYNQTVGVFNQWFQRQISIEDLRNYKNEDGSYRSWNIGGPLDPRPKYWDSPYTQMYANTNRGVQHRVFGNLGLTYKLADFLTASVKARRDFASYMQEGRVASGTVFAGGLGQFAYLSANTLEENYEGLLNFSKSFKTISIFGNIGGNIRKNRSEGSYQATEGGLTSPNFYAISASVNRPTSRNYRNEYQVNSLYGNLSLGYKDMVFIEGSLRNDWSSTLPKKNNSYLYPSVSGSFVFSELLPASRVLSYGKIRAGYAQVGTDVGPYQTSLTYSVSTYNGQPTMFLPSTLPNQNMKPGMATSYEGGFDLKFLRNRVGLEITAYKNNNRNQIIPLPVVPTSGFNSALINAGLIQTNGLELHIYVNPIRSESGFNWEFDINADRSRSKVVELQDGLTNYLLGSDWVTITNNARKGEEWGLLVGRKIRRLDGKALVNEAGNYLYDDNQPLGSILPKFKGGFLNSFRYKNLTLRLNTDFVAGGKFYSMTKAFLEGSGLSASTVGNNSLGNPKRDPVSEGGGVILDAVYENGQPNITAIDARTYYKKAYTIDETYVFDRSYVKMREISLGYFVPQRYLGKLIKTANVSVIARNPFMIWSAIGGGIDISEAERNWSDGGQLPPVRSIGLNVKLGL
ncbi:SusC/RagA family TonB-linked outer membrane protein [Dyadobacter jiangsuensis]